MRDRTLITTGSIGAVLAAISCMTPLLVVVFGAGRAHCLARQGRLCADPGANPVSRTGSVRPLPQTPAPRMTDRISRREPAISAARFRRNHDP
jgi:hypothetical protein